MELPRYRIYQRARPRHDVQNQPSRMKILIVEDHPDMRELLRFILVSLEHVPVVARDGKDGVEKAVSEKPHLILMDIRMPVMHGWEAVKTLRAYPEKKTNSDMGNNLYDSSCRSQSVLGGRL